MKKNYSIRLYIGIVVFVFLIVGCIGFIFFINNQPKGYPIDSEVSTTLDRTVISVSIPPASPKLSPYEISKYAEYGYGNWEFGSGLPYQKRLDLLPSSYKETSATHTANLFNFFVMTDIHITDEESPAQAIALYNQGGVYSVYSGVMLYTTQVLNAAIQTINTLHKQNPFDFGISLGDAINSTQYNELRWYIDVLDGKKINPDSGIKDDPIAGPHNDYQDTYQAVGLDKSIPWYQALGNHDHFWMGFLPANDYIRQTILSDKILNLGNPFINPLGVDSRGYYMGSLDGQTPYGNIISAGPVKDFPISPKIAAADPLRRSLSTMEWMNEFFNTSSNPQGHGFNQADVANGWANYTFEPKSDLPIKVIVLDDTQSNNDPNDPRALGFGKGSYGYGHGELDDKRYKWLVSELDKGQAAGQLMIIAAHEPIAVEKSPSMMAWNPSSEATLMAKLHTYPNLLMWVAGHRHLNTVTALKSPDSSRPELGFWEVETSSLRDFPQQFRAFQIVRNSDSTISILATNVDPAVKKGSPAEKSRSYAIAAQQIYKMTLPLMPSGSYNAELVKQLTPQMQVKIQNYQAPDIGR
jgi:metallophosphoesterase (TIGR03768 family)